MGAADIISHKLVDQDEVLSDKWLSTGTETFHKVLTLKKQQHISLLTLYTSYC